MVVTTRVLLKRLSWIKLCPSDRSRKKSGPSIEFHVPTSVRPSGWSSGGGRGGASQSCVCIDSVTWIYLLPHTQCLAIRLVWTSLDYTYDAQMEIGAWSLRVEFNSSRKSLYFSLPKTYEPITIYTFFFFQEKELRIFFWKIYSLHHYWL